MNGIKHESEIINKKVITRGYSSSFIIDHPL